MIGAFSLFRQEVRPFTDKQIELVTNFAAQAVIAIENARLLNELRQRTTRSHRGVGAADRDCRCAASYQPLAVDLAAVLDNLIETATSLCGAKFEGSFSDGTMTCIARPPYNATACLIEL